MPEFDLILWDDEDDIDGNVWHIAPTGLTTDEIEDALSGSNVRDEPSRSSGRPASFAFLPDGRRNLRRLRTLRRGWYDLFVPHHRVRGLNKRGLVAKPEGAMAHKRLEDLSPEQRAAAVAFLAKNKTAARKIELAQVREQARLDVPPLRISEDLAAAVAGFRMERERQGLTQADISKRSGLDQTVIERLEAGEIPNPPAATLEVYARSIGRRLTWASEPLAVGR